MLGNVETKIIIVINGESEARVRVKVTIDSLPAKMQKN